MSLYYVTTNLVDSLTLPQETYVSSEDSIYVYENLYNGRPSKPFRFTTKANQWIKVQLLSSQAVTFVGLFGHNLTSGATLTLESAAADAGYGLVKTLTWRDKNLYKLFNGNDKWWKLNVSDAGNSAYPQIGEYVLGTWSKFDNARVQPGRADGPAVYMADKVSHYGQDWSKHYANTEGLTIRLMNLNDPSVVDDLQTFLKDIFENSDGKFILIPDHEQPHCFYVRVKNRRDFARRLVYGTKELREWKLELETLAEGITLL